MRLDERILEKPLSLESQKQRHNNKSKKYLSCDLLENFEFDLTEIYEVTDFKVL